MKSIYLFIAIFLTSLALEAQTQDIDLSQKSGLSINIISTVRSIRLINCSKNAKYKLDWKITSNLTPFFILPVDATALSSNDSKLQTCSKEIKDLIINLDNENAEEKIKDLIEKARIIIAQLGTDNCAIILKKSIDETEQVQLLPVVLQNNQTITLTINKTIKGSSDSSQWSYILKTPEKTRWLVHYGLTYAPSLISKVDHFHSLADTSAANRYTITKDNNNGPKPWDNISATINFTYPFHGDSRGFDGGFTAGFGISTGLGLSGHAGLSAIIGDNVIISSGVALMQKYKLKGDYKEGQIIKENLSSDALHEKVWLPEIFFTIGFRFGSNPFASKTTSSTGTASTNAAQ